MSGILRNRVTAATVFWRAATIVLLVVSTGCEFETQKERDAADVHLQLLNTALERGVVLQTFVASVEATELLDGVMVESPDQTIWSPADGRLRMGLIFYWVKDGELYRLNDFTELFLPGVPLASEEVIAAAHELRATRGVK